jgi:hypothetical protein
MLQAPVSSSQILLFEMSVFYRFHGVIETHISKEKVNYLNYHHFC